MCNKVSSFEWFLRQKKVRKAIMAAQNSRLEKAFKRKRRWVVGKHHHQEWWQRNSGWKGERGLWLWHGWDVIWNIKILGEFCQVARSNPTFYLFRVYLELFGVTKCLINLGKLVKTVLLAPSSCFAPKYSGVFLFAWHSVSYRKWQMTQSTLSVSLSY